MKGVCPEMITGPKTVLITGPKTVQNVGHETIIFLITFTEAKEPRIHKIRPLCRRKKSIAATLTKAKLDASSAKAGEN